VTREVDLIEEVARVRMDDLPFTLPLRRAMFGSLTPLQRLRRRVEDVLAGLGLSEIYTPSLVPAAAEPDGLALPDPMGDQAVLRQTLLHGLVDAAGRNVSVGNERIGLFEIARVYLSRGEELPVEQVHVGGIVEGGFAAGKGVVEAVYRALKVQLHIEREARPFLYPGRAARIGEGWLGELHPTVLEGAWGVFELDLEALLVSSNEPIQYEDVITYPAVKQDLAFAVDESVAAGDLIAAAREAAGPELRELRVFDVYRGEQVGAGKKSIAFAAAFQSPERTLSDDDAAAIRARIVAALAERFGAVLRA
jgi:phenylalanyl-tRNA synthetase beta chain